MGEDITTTNVRHLHDDELVEEADEALSLCDLPLDLDTNNNNNPRSDHSPSILRGKSRRSSSSFEASPEFFEFLNHRGSDMCPAEDMIFYGKLIPTKQQQPFAFQTLEDSPLRDKGRSASLSDLRSNSKKRAALLRNNRSVDSQKLHRPESVEKSEVSTKKPLKPRWYFYVFMFGRVKLPPAMELKDIKSRQFRQNPSVMFPIIKDDGKKPAGDRSSSDKSCSWSLLKALSCRDYSSVPVTSSFWMSPA